MISVADLACLLNRMKNIFCLLTCLFFFKQGTGQNIAFNHLTVENGLSHNAVLAIAQDSYGFMWYGTGNGLNRYDGHRFRIYKMTPEDSTSISSNNILSIYPDSKHTLWIGTSYGLNKYDPRKDVFERITGIGSQSVNCIYEDKKANLWIGTGSGLYLLTNRQRNTFRSFFASGSTNSIAGNMIRSIYEDHNGHLWIGTNNGLTKLRLINGVYQYETFRHDPNDPGSLSANYITTIAEDSLQNLWIGTQNSGVNLYQSSPDGRNVNGFVKFTHSISNPSGLINNSIRKIITDKAGKIWIGTQEGLSIIDPVSKSIHSYQHDAGNKKSLSQNSIHSLFEDANGSVWAGTYFGGVNITYSYTTSFTSLQNSENRSSISNNVISSVTEDEKHNLWIGTEGGGLNYFNRASGLFTVYKNILNDPASIGSNLIKVVYRDKDGNIWAGTHGGGLNLFDPDSKKFKRFLFKANDAETLNAEVISLLEDHAGRFWVSSTSGLKLFRRNKTALEPMAVNSLTGLVINNLTKALLEDSKKRIWIGTSSGLYVIVNNTIKEIHPGYPINCIQEDAKGNIWVGLYYGGVAMYDEKNNHFDQYTEKDGLPNSNVIGILEDDKNNLWLSTDNGLVKFNPAQKSFQTYTVSDGLAGNEFNYNSFFKDSKGEFFFGGYNGLTNFFPGKIETNKYAAPVVFTGLKLFNNPVDINGEDKLLKENISLTKNITFRYNQDVFSIEFALLNFIKSNKNKYAYKLEGFDKDWNEVTTTSATYTNLPSGSYTFLVKAANNDGVWSESAALKIKVLPPFWLTWWAYCLYALILASILFLVIRFFFLRALLKKEDELHQVKLNFFTNISHEIRTHLTLIMAPVDKMLENKKQDSFIRHQLGNVKTNANRLLKLVSELMDFRKAETKNLTLHIGRHDIVSFLYEIYTSFQDLSLSKNIKVSFVHDSENIAVYFDKEQLEKVFFNLLTNAFKFTPEGGRICMNLEQKENKIKVSVTDNGRGIAPQFMEKLFTNFFQVAEHGLQNTGYGIGLALSKNIVELHKGTITVESEPASPNKEGTTSFTVTLLTGNKHFEGTQHIQENITFQKTVVPEPENPQQFASATILNGEIKDKQFSVLIAEDNDELREVIKETFENHYHIIQCENGLEAWETATEQIPDMIISDVMMPEMDGFTLCQQLKTDERTSHIPVILLTAKSSQSDQVSGLETGADIYITKPFGTKVLELSVRNLLSSREKMRQKFSHQIIAEPVPDKTTAETVEDSFVNSVDKEFLEKVMLLIEDHMDDPEFGVAMLAKKVAMSQPILYKKLKAVTDMSVNDFIKSLRLKKAAQLLHQKDLTVYEIAYAVGYNDRKYFSQEFKKQFGKTPSEFAGAGIK